MKVTCPSCNATGNVDTSKMPPGANLKCPKCGNSFALPEEALTPPPPPAAPSIDFGEPPEPPPETPPETLPETPTIGDTGSDTAATIYVPPPAPDLTGDPTAEAGNTGNAGNEATLYEPPPELGLVPQPVPPPIPGGSDELATESAELTDLGGGTRISFSGKGGELFGIFIVNLLLTLVTLSFYRFWGKVKVRKYLYGHSELLTQRLSYHGTGKELLIGWLKAAGIVIVLLVIINGSQMLPIHIAVIALIQFAAGLFFYYLMIYAMVGSKRYRLSRTSWYGIRFSFRGRVNEALKIFVGGAILTSITFGIYAPWYYINQQRFWVTNSHFGNKPFNYEGKGGELFLIFLLAFLIFFGGAMFVSIIIPVVAALTGGLGEPGAPTGSGAAAVVAMAMPLLIFLIMGIAYAFFRARTDRYHWSKTTYEGVNFESTFTTGKLLGFYITNALILIFTLGLGLPLVMIRILNFRFDNLIMTGAVDLEGIKQDAQAAETTGEGMADFLDLDGGLF